MLPDKKMSLLIIDDDTVLCDAFKGYLHSFSQFDVIEPINSGDEAINIIERHKPDIIILDLVLPVYDGMYIVDYIAENMISYKPLIYVMSLLGSAKTAQLLNHSDIVKFYSIKPVLPQVVIKNLIRLVNSAQTPEKAEANRFSTDEFENLDWFVEDFLKKLGLQTNLISSKCARIAIEVAMRSDRNERLGMMDIYVQVGQVFTPPLSRAAVDRNLRSVTARAIRSRTPVFDKIFKNSLRDKKNELNNSIFLWEVADALRAWVAENGYDTSFS